MTDDEFNTYLNKKHIIVVRDAKFIKQINNLKEYVLGLERIIKELGENYESVENYPLVDIMKKNPCLNHFFNDFNKLKQEHNNETSSD